jgi:hypothetical protein
VRGQACTHGPRHGPSRPLYAAMGVLKCRAERTEQRIEAGRRRTKQVCPPRTQACGWLVARQGADRGRVRNTSSPHARSMAGMPSRARGSLFAAASMLARQTTTLRANALVPISTVPTAPRSALLSGITHHLGTGRASAPSSTSWHGHDESPGHAAVGAWNCRHADVQPRSGRRGSSEQVSRGQSSPSRGRRG